MKNRWLILSIFGVFLLSSCGTSGYYSSTFTGDPIYYKRTKSEIKASVEQQKKIHDNKYTKEYALLEGESYEQRILKFDDNTTYIVVNDNPWYSSWYSPWYNPWWGSLHYGYYPAAYAGWWGFSHYYNPWYSHWYDPWYYDRWWWHNNYWPEYYPGHDHPGSGPAHKDVTYAKRNYNTGGPRSTGVSSYRGTQASGRPASQSNRQAQQTRRSSTNVRNNGYNNSDRNSISRNSSSYSSFSNSSSNYNSGSSYSGGSSRSSSSSSGYTGSGSHSGGGRR